MICLLPRSAPLGPGIVDRRHSAPVPHNDLEYVSPLHSDFALRLCTPRVYKNIDGVTVFPAKEAPPAGPNESDPVSFPCLKDNHQGDGSKYTNRKRVSFAEEQGTREFQVVA